MRLEGETARGGAEVEVARVAFAGRGQADAGDGFSGDFGADEPGYAGQVSRAPVLSSDASISDIVLSDRDGAWLRIDKVRLIWNRLALFSGGWRSIGSPSATLSFSAGRFQPKRLRRRIRVRARSCRNCRSR
jgi:hypothetical protein